MANKKTDDESDQEPTETEKVTEARGDRELFSADDLTIQAPEEWERAWFVKLGKAPESLRTLRVTVQHGAGAAYPALMSSDVQHHEGSPPRWSVPQVTEPLTGAEFLAFAISAGIHAASKYRTRDSRRPKDAVIRVLCEGPDGGSLLKLKRRYELSDDEDQQPEEPEINNSATDDGHTPMIPALPVIERLFSLLEKLVPGLVANAGKQQSSMSVGGSGGIPMEFVQMLLGETRAAGEARGMASAMSKLGPLLGGRSRDDDDDDDDPPEEVNPHRRLLIEQIPSVFSSFADVGKEIGKHAVDKVGSAFGIGGNGSDQP